MPRAQAAAGRTCHFCRVFCSFCEFLPKIAWYTRPGAVPAAGASVVRGLHRQARPA
jgi:hypothetical protein